MSVKTNTRMSLKQLTFQHTHSEAQTHDIFITYRVPPIVVMYQIIKAMHLKYMYLSLELQTKELYMKITKKYEFKMCNDSHFEF